MRVADILKQKGNDVATIVPDATVAAAAARLRELNIGALVVTGDGSTIDGILSERDIVRELGAQRGTLLDEPVSSIMTADVFTCGPKDRVEQLMALMTSERIRHLPVVVDGALSGIVSIGDVVKNRLAELETDARVMEDYIHHGR